MNTLISDLAARLRGLSPAAVFTLSVLAALALGAVDCLTPPRMSFTLFYLFAVTWTAWAAGRWPATIMAAIAAACTIAEEYWVTPAAAHDWILPWNGLTRLTVFTAVAWLTAEATRLTRHLGSLAEQQTERWKAEADQHRVTLVQLAASEKRYHSLFENMLEGFAYGQVLYEEGRPRDIIFLEVNRAFERLTGLKEVAGKKVSEVIPGFPQSNPELIEAYRRVAHTGVSERLESNIAPLALWLSVSVYGMEPDRFVAIFDDITERKRAEEALRASQRQLAEAMDLARVVNWEYDVESGLFTFDNRFFALYGTSTADEGSYQMSAEAYAREFLYPEDAPRMAEQIAKAAASADPHYTAQVERRIRRRDGGTRHLLINMAALKDAQGRTVKLRGASQDVTERKEAEERLAEALDLNRMLIAASPVGIAVFRASGECILSNAALAQIIGGSLRGRNFHDLDSWQSQGLAKQADEVLNSRQPRQFEFHGLTPFGKTIFVNLHFATFISHAELHLLMLVNDITRRKRAELLLQAQRDVGISLSETSDLQTALERLLDIAAQAEGIDCGGIYLLDPASGEWRLAAHRGVSGAFAQQFGRHLAESVQAGAMSQGKPIYSKLACLPVTSSAARDLEGQRAAALIPLFHEGRVLGSLNLASQIRGEIPAQTRVVIETIAAQAAGAIARIRAEAERHRLERQILEISDREQARIGQEIHDGLCQQLVSLAFDANSLEDQLAQLRRPEAATARRIALYLDQAITEARQLSRGLFPIRLEPNGLPSALEELARTASDRFHVPCSFETGGPVPVADKAMATHLYRIAQEAVINAAKHSGAQAITICLRSLADGLELTVTDDGGGLPSTGAGKSTGLGLHIMEYRAHSIGGSLRLGAGPAGGTRVCCLVPCHRE